MSEPDADHPRRRRGAGRRHARQRLRGVADGAAAAGQRAGAARTAAGTAAGGRGRGDRACPHLGRRRRRGAQRVPARGLRGRRWPHFSLALRDAAEARAAARRRRAGCPSHARRSPQRRRDGWLRVNHEIIAFAADEPPYPHGVVHRRAARRRRARRVQRPPGAGRRHRAGLGNLYATPAPTQRGAGCPASRSSPTCCRACSTIAAWWWPSRGRTCCSTWCRCWWRCWGCCGCGRSAWWR